MTTRATNVHRASKGRGWLLSLAAMLVLGAPPALAHTPEVTIAAASDLHFAFKELVGEFEKQTAVHVKLSFGSSGNFYSQIEQGAPFDLYFSADIRYPQKLVEAGLAVRESLRPYALGRLVLWAPKGTAITVGQGLAVLRDATVKKIAIANPKHAPYGRAAVSAMTHAGLDETVQAKLVLGENISQAAQFVQSGACDVGIIALSLALAPTMKATGTYWLIPAEAHPPIEQGVVMLTRAKDHRAARAFLDFLQGPIGQRIMARYGFTLPPKEAS